MSDERKEPEWTIEAFIAGARWARMAMVGGNHTNDALLDQDAKYFAETGGDIRCRSRADHSASPTQTVESVKA